MKEGLGFELRAREGRAVGTGREVVWVTSTVPEAGKTEVAAGLIEALARAGRRPVGMKSIELAATYGADHDLLSPDADLLGSKGPIQVPPLVRAPYRFAARTSPAAALSMLGIELSLEDLAATVEAAATYGAPVVVDSPGAAFSRLLPTCFGLDLAAHLGATIVLVVPELPAGDVPANAVIDGCRRRGLSVAGIVTTRARWSATELDLFVRLVDAPLLLRLPQASAAPWDTAARTVLDALLG